MTAIYKESPLGLARIVLFLPALPLSPKGHIAVVFLERSGESMPALAIRDKI